MHLSRGARLGSGLGVSPPPTHHILKIITLDYQSSSFSPCYCKNSFFCILFLNIVNPSTVIAVEVGVLKMEVGGLIMEVGGLIMEVGVRLENVA